MNPLATINIIIQYEGSGFILLLYAAAFVLLLKNETDRGNRVLFGYLPLALCVLFLLPPVHGIYSKIEGSDTYYRLFWLLPAGTTIVYAAVRTFADHLRRMLILMALRWKMNLMSLEEEEAISICESRKPAAHSAGGAGCVQHDYQ